MFGIPILEILYLALTVLGACYVKVDMDYKRDYEEYRLDPYCDSIIREDVITYFIVSFTIIFTIVLILNKFDLLQLYYFIRNVFPFIIGYSIARFFINYVILKRIHIK